MQKIGFCDKYSLTQAVLDGTKTMTRRLDKALERAVAAYEQQYGEPFEIISQCWDEYRMYVLTNHGTIYINTRYRLNEVVAVAQAYKDAGIDPHYLMFATVTEKFSCVEKEIEAMFTKGWNNKMFVRADLMPNQILITGVRIERLQDICDKDCLKEGVIQRAHPFVKEAKDVYVCPNIEGYFTHPRACFSFLIDRPGVGHKGLWGSNPFVVVYEFQLAK